MAKRSEHVTTQALMLVTIIYYLIPFAFCNDASPVPNDRAIVNSWFKQNVRPISSRRENIDPALVAAEANTKIIKVRKDGTGQYNNLGQAIASIPSGNKNRYIISIGPGQYYEKVKIGRNLKYITLIGANSKNKPVLNFNGNGKKFGTFYSATLTVEAEYFSAIYITIKNSTPRPRLGMRDQQGVALRIGADKASFFDCNFIGFQDTLLDDTGRHFFKNCYIEGTIDFIFGAGRSIYLDCHIHLIPGDMVAIITAQGAPTKISVSGYSFIHCKITGGNTGTGFLGRAWRKNPQVVFSYSYLSNTINPLGWSNNQNPGLDRTVFYAEYKNTGPKSGLNGRYKYMKKFADPQAKPFISLGYIMASKWLLPPRS